ncbi:acyl-CoA dehydrogenase family protein [Streptomyces spongiae]|uniref:Acyl-CoA dehydrogenase n=1 Tax=Streptomyces spongiae TaxID=565072 RepID=A0A5N8XCC9_9ACTN|nr:acyl-CoA dehydrogenase family protein [Streptomyces spongiae]MPY56185.1 acyl-CoA dehydrogenase [Streptomyces spongiae]
MTTAAAPATATTADRVLEGMRTILSTVRDNADRAEAERTLPQSSAKALTDAGLARALAPRRFGGYELPLTVWFDLVREISAVDASHGWCASLLVHHSHYIALFPLAAQEEVWADGPDVAVTTAIAPVLTATATDGGYRLSGRTAWASGVNHADWSIVGAMLPGTNPPEHTFFLIPASEYTIEQSWDTIGMRGTGSDTIVVEDAFVPEVRTLKLSDIREGRAPGGGLHDAAYYRAPWVTYAPATFVTPMLGAAQGALDQFLASAAERATAQGNKVADFTSVQYKLSQIGADLDAAELLIRRALELSGSGADIGLDLRARCTRDYSRAAELIVEAIDLLMGMSGSGGFATSRSIQRVWRDVHLAASHLSLSPQQNYQHWGRTHLGLDRTPGLGMY